MQEYYKILGISESASIEEINDAYNRLKSQYSKDRFLEGEAGNEAAKKLTKLETAYSEIMNNINDSKDYNDANPSFDAIEKYGKSRKSEIFSIFFNSTKLPLLNSFNLVLS